MNENNTLDTFYLIDLDRTVFDTVQGAALIVSIISEYDPAIAEIIRIRIDEYAHFGVSFSIRETITEFADEEVAQSIEGKYIEAAQHIDLLLPGAQELLEWVKHKEGSAGGLLTFGSIPGQKMKIVAGKLDAFPYLITQIPHKGELMASWKQGDEFVLPEEYGSVRAKRLVLIDDRIQSFEGMPEHAIGYWYTKEEATPLDEVPMPSGVTRVKTLQEVIDQE